MDEDEQDVIFGPDADELGAHERTLFEVHHAAGFFHGDTSGFRFGFGVAG